MANECARAGGGKSIRFSLQCVMDFITDTYRTKSRVNTVDAFAHYHNIWLNIPVFHGENQLELYTFCTIPSQGEFYVPNDFTQPYPIYGNFQANAITAALQLDKRVDDGNCQNLYAIYPNDQYSWWWEPTPPDGGSFSVYGSGTIDQPRYEQMWQLSYDDTVHYGSDYRLRVCWVKDLQHGGTLIPPVEYKVIISLNEGTPEQNVFQRFG